ncbi:AAA family ATPase [Limosilactobacillus gastricus]|uniref:AAA family ATPase n=1 Tax=Limosilactobacillus gastricus TaxID=227942 RepID=UPI0026EAAA83|nr:ATP-dependent Clp protease ATP-binding subunit [Limosilactobacillus gastricus]
MIKGEYLKQYTDDLTAMAKQNPDDYIAIGRDQEIQQVIHNLNRRTKNNPILIGKAGVGKTAIVEGLVRLMVLGKAGERLYHKKLLTLQVAALGEHETNQKMLHIIDELKAADGEYILFIDEIHTIMGSDSTGGADDLGDVLKPAMSRGEIQLIGSTTLDEYDKFIARDPALQRRFQEVNVQEPTRDVAITILKGIKLRYEQYHHVKYDDAAVEACVTLAERYIADRYLPDKAIDLMDQAGAIAETNHQEQITIREIAQVLQDIQGIPVTTILKNDNDRLKNMRKRLNKIVKGQERAINTVTDAITIAKAGLQAPNKPLSSFLFLGPTGVGKTALSKALAKIMFDDEEAMIRLDMSEYSERSSLDRFQNLVTTQIKRKPYCILLLDEIEKSCTAVHDRLLQVLDDGELRDNRDRRTNFRNCIIIMTTNLGAEFIAEHQSLQGDDNTDFNLDLSPEEEQHQAAIFKSAVEVELTNVFRPEFVNRIDHKVVFNMLTRKIIREIAINNLNMLNARMHNHGFKLFYDDRVIDYLADIGTDVVNGARPLARCIETDVAAPLSMLIIQLENKPDNNIHRIRARVIGSRPTDQLEQHLAGDREIIFEGLVDQDTKGDEVA